MLLTSIIGVIMSEYFIFGLGLLAVIASIVVGIVSARKKRASKVMRKHGVLEYQRSLKQFQKSQR